MSGAPTEIVDAQVHAWEQNNPRHPWDPTYAHTGPVATATLERNRRWEMTVDRLLGEMAAVGVDAAIIVTPSLYGYDNSYPLEAAAQHPGRFGVVGRVDPRAPDLEEQVRAWRAQPGALALRSVVTSQLHLDELHGGKLERLFRACETHDVPLCAFWPRHLPEFRSVVESYPRLQFVVDHLGLPQPPLMQVDADRFSTLPDLLALAAYPNVAVKLSAAPTLSLEGFPYRDIWPKLHQIVDAFGLDRVMWGSDFTRVAELLSYDQSLAYIRDTDELSASDKERLLGQTTRAVFRWPRPSTTAAPDAREAGAAGVS